MSHTNPYGIGLITKSNAGKLFMNAKSMYDNTSGKIIKMPRNSKCTNPPIEWFMSEKYDGYRAMWDGSRFVSRQGNVYNAPEWFTQSLPRDKVLDGELYAGREQFQKCGAVRHKIPIDEDWSNIVYQIYDIPSEFNKSFTDRYDLLYNVVMDCKKRWIINAKKSKNKFEKIECPYRFTFHIPIENEEMMNKYYNIIIGKGGEGIMLKCPSSPYEGKRSSYLLKYKPKYDAEGMIIGYNYGSGKYSGILGSFICAPINGGHVINDDKLYFSISGMDDNIRKSYKTTHPIGTIVTYDYAGMTNDGKPRFAQYSRIREDIEITDSHIPNKNKPQSTSYNDKLLLISIFNTLETYEKEQRQHHKARVYKKTLDALNDLPGDVIEFHHIPTITSVRGIGKKIASKIEEYINTGSISMYDKIKITDTKLDIKETLCNIYGIGSVKSKELVETHNINSIDDLIKRTDLLNDKQIIGLNYYEDLLKRIPRIETVSHDNLICKVFNSIGAQAYIMGSYRRHSPDNGDIDVLICTKDDDQSKYVQGIELLKKMGYINEDLAFGDKKYMGICKLNRLRKNTRLNPKHRRIDIMFSVMKEMPFSLLYFTGSAELNKKMRKKALDMGFSINEHCIIDKKTKEKVKKDFKSEKDIFTFLGMEYIEPENR